MRHKRYCLRLSYFVLPNHQCHIRDHANGKGSNVRWQAREKNKNEKRTPRRMVIRCGSPVEFLECRRYKEVHNLLMAGYVPHSTAGLVRVSFISSNSVSSSSNRICGGGVIVLKIRFSKTAGLLRRGISNLSYTPTVTSETDKRKPSIWLAFISLPKPTLQKSRPRWTLGSECVEKNYILQVFWFWSFFPIAERKKIWNQRLGYSRLWTWPCPCYLV